jgi:hypothetical protein
MSYDDDDDYYTNIEPFDFAKSEEDIQAERWEPYFRLDEPELGTIKETQDPYDEIPEIRLNRFRKKIPMRFR